MAANLSFIQFVTWAKGLTQRQLAADFGKPHGFWL